MYRLLLWIFVCIALGACSGGGSGPSNTLPPPGSPNGPPPKSPTPSPTPTATPFNSAAVHISETSASVTPLYLAAGPDGAVYYGFGSNGTGSVLYRLLNASTTTTLPADPPNGEGSGGGVYGITVTSANAVYWLSAYFVNDFNLSIQVECGASAKATICQPTVDEPTTMLVDASGVFWVGGLAFQGGGEVATSANASAMFANGSVMQLLNGPDHAVWAVLADYSKNPTQYTLAQLAVAGSSIAVSRHFPLPSGDSVTSVTLGGDGNFWFTDFAQNAIGRISTAGVLKEFPLTASAALGGPWFGQVQIATACDGAVWFSEPGPNKIGRMDSSGTLTEFALPSASADPGPVAAVPRATCAAPELWVGEQHTNSLASVSY